MLLSWFSGGRFMPDQLDAKWERLVAIAERLANQGPPSVNVHIHVDSAGKRKRINDQNKFGESQGEDAEPVDVGARAPHPYVS
jgi:hypothetical protein